MEEWRTVNNTNGLIEVSNLGRVRSLLRGEPFVLKQGINHKGYKRVSITIDRKKKTYFVHRLVANAFIPNPKLLPQVNHIDGNKENNSVNNLEWVTNQENAVHAIENGLWDSVITGARAANEKQRKPIIAYKDNESIEFKSICDAQNYFGSRHITDVLKGKRSHVKGWSFSYVERG